MRIASGGIQTTPTSSGTRPLHNFQNEPADIFAREAIQEEMCREKIIITMWGNEGH